MADAMIRPTISNTAGIREEPAICGIRAALLHYKAVYGKPTYTQTQDKPFRWVLRYQGFSVYLEPMK